MRIDFGPAWVPTLADTRISEAHELLGGSYRIQEVVSEGGNQAIEHFRVYDMFVAKSARPFRYSFHVVGSNFQRPFWPEFKVV